MLYKNKILESKNLIRNLFNYLNKKEKNKFTKEINLLCSHFLFVTPIFLIIEKVLICKKINWKKHHQILKKILKDIINFEINHHAVFLKFLNKKWNFNFLFKKQNFDQMNNHTFAKENDCKIDQTNLNNDQINEIKKIGVFFGNIFRLFWSDLLKSKKNEKVKKIELKIAYWFGYHYASLITIKKKHFHKINKKTKLLIPILFFSLKYIENLRLLLPLNFNYLVIKTNNLLFKN